MTRIDYWKEAFDNACADANAKEYYWTLSPEQIELIAESLQESADNIGMAFPSPGGYGVQMPRKDPEIVRLENRIKELEKEAENERMNFKKNVAMRRGCDIHDVTLGENGHAEYK